MKRSVELRLEDIVDFATKAQRLLADRDAATLAADEASYLAAIYSLQCVSEAARSLPDEIKERAPHLPWRSIEDSSNVFRHGYHVIDPERVRATIANNLPELIAFARRELTRLGSNSS